MMTAPIYNMIGVTYDVTRRADPEILAKLIQHLSPKQEGKYLDIGCGSGNYTHALFNTGIEMVGIDISEEMLSKAKDKNNSIKWVHGDARQMPFPKNSFDGAICVLATHHIKDLKAAFQEVFRVVREGYFVIFTSFPEQMKMYWLNHYFPYMMKRAQDNMVSYEKIKEALSGAGFTHVQKESLLMRVMKLLAILRTKAPPIVDIINLISKQCRRIDKILIGAVMISVAIHKLRVINF